MAKTAGTASAARRATNGWSATGPKESKAWKSVAAGERVGLEEVGDGIWAVYFGTSAPGFV